MAVAYVFGINYYGMRLCVKANNTDDWHAFDLLGYTHSKERPIIANISVADFILMNMTTNDVSDG